MKDTKSRYSKTYQQALGTLPMMPTTGGLSASVSRVYALLVNRTDVYLTSANGQYYTQTETPLTRQLIEDAIQGKVVLGLPSVSGNGTSRWICIDADTPEQWAQLSLIAQELQPQGHIILERSRRGGHLWAFFRSVDWQIARNYGLELAGKYDLEGIEIFPKHGGISQARIPGSIHPKTGKPSTVIHPGTGEVLALTDALNQIAPITLVGQYGDDTHQQPSMKHQSSPDSTESSAQFTELVELLSAHTPIKVYSANRAKAKCLWHHPDNNPSLYIKGGRFHCLSDKCAVWGDVTDLKRWLDKRIDPPTN